MKNLLSGLLLLVPAFAVGQSAPAATSSPIASAGTTATAEAPHRIPTTAPPIALESTLGFRSLYYLLNRSAWPALPHDGGAVRSGPAVVDLADPLQTIVIFNAWHLPAGTEDIRLADLRKHVLRSAVVFTSDWPDYETPGFIVLVQKRNREWALVARLSGQYLIEDRSGIGVCAIPVP